MAVSLSEITAIEGNPLTAAGTAGTGANLAQLPPDVIGLQALQTAANMRMMANKFALEEFNQRQRDYLQNFNQIDITGVMESDAPGLYAAFAKYAQKLAANMDVIGNPYKNPQLRSQLAGEEAAIRGKIAQSKQHLATRNSFANFISQHPDFQTPDNLSRLSAFSAQPLDQRQVDTLTAIAPRFDLNQDEFAKLANQAALQQTREQDTAVPFTNDVAVTEYLKGAYDNTIRSLIRGNDGFNRPMMQAISSAFARQSPDIQQQYTNPDGSFRVEDFAVEQLYGPLRQQTNTAILRDPNKFALAEMGQQNAEDLARLQSQLRRGDARYQKSLNEEEANLAAAQVVQRQLDVFGRPDKVGAKRQVINPQLQSTGNKQADELIDSFSKLFDVETARQGVTGTGQEVVEVPLDNSLIQAYSIKGPTRRVYNAVTRKEEESDSYLRPQKAFVTTEAEPDARKVIVRYQTPEGARDIVLPYTQNFQALDNLYGSANAAKTAGARSRLLKDLTGKINPGTAELRELELFREPEPNAPAAEPVIAPPVNPTTGSFLNARDWKARQKNTKR